MPDTAPHVPSCDTEASVTAVRALSDELTNIVGVARALVEAGRDVDLAGLDRQVGLLCAKTLDLPPDEGRRLRPRLIALSATVETLLRAMAARDPTPS
jgi:hypothetical protein